MNLIATLIGICQELFSKKFPGSFFPLCLSSLWFQYLVMISNLETRTPWESSSVHMACVWLSPSATATVPQAPPCRRRTVLGNVYQRLWSGHSSQSNVVPQPKHYTRDCPTSRTSTKWVWRLEILENICLENEGIRMLTLSEYWEPRQGVFEMPCANHDGKSPFCDLNKTKQQ